MLGCWRGALLPGCEGQGLAQEASSLQKDLKECGCEVDLALLKVRSSGGPCRPTFCFEQRPTSVLRSHNQGMKDTPVFLQHLFSSSQIPCHCIWKLDSSVIAGFCLSPPCILKLSPHMVAAKHIN